MLDLREPVDVSALLARCLALLDVEIKRLEQSSEKGAFPLEKKEQEALISYSKTIVLLQNAQAKAESPPGAAVDVEDAILQEAKKIKEARNVGKAAKLAVAKTPR